MASCMSERDSLLTLPGGGWGIVAVLLPMAVRRGWVISRPPARLVLSAFLLSFRQLTDRLGKFTNFCERFHDAVGVFILLCLHFI